MTIPKAIRRAVQTRQDERAVPALQRYVAHCLKRRKPRAALPALLLDLIQWEREPASQSGPPVHPEQTLALAEQEGRWLGLLLMGFYLGWLGSYSRSVALLLDKLVGWALRQPISGPPAFLALYLLASRDTNQHDPRIRLLIRALEQAHAVGDQRGERFYALMFGCQRAAEDGILDEARAILNQLEVLHAATPPATQFWPPPLSPELNFTPQKGLAPSRRRDPGTVWKSSLV